jgi:hypothetical protein
MLLIKGLWKALIICKKINDKVLLIRKKSSHLLVFACVKKLKRSSLVCLTIRFDVMKGRFVDMAGKEEADLEGFPSEVDVEAAVAGDASREPEDRGDIGKDLENYESGKSDC